MISGSGAPFLSLRTNFTLLADYLLTKKIATLICMLTDLLDHQCLVYGVELY